MEGSMKKRPLDLHEKPSPGRSLVEASAGTGKTYSLAILVLKFIIELGIPLEKILIVTFTRDATAELRERIRLFLADAQVAFRTPDNFDRNKNEHITAMLDASSDDALKLKLHSIRVDRALAHVDEAPVYTIHAFCQKILKEFSFETQTPSGLALFEDDSAFTAGASEYAFRKFWYREELAVIETVAALGKGYLFDCSSIGAMVRTRLNNPLAELMPVTKSLDGARAAFLKAAAECLGAIHDAAALWLSSEREILQLLDNFSLLDGRSYRIADIDVYRSAFEYLSRMRSVEFGGDYLILRKFTPELLRAKLKKTSGDISLAHKAFDACKMACDLCDAYQLHTGEYIIALKKAMIECAVSRYEVEKKRHSALTYNDLLLRLARSLESSNASGLAQKVSERYDAILVDEFQDTDLIQYSIFSALFTDKRKYFYCIGDPKQSIYSFRGADIHTYLETAPASSNIFSLETNRRSSKALVDAVNFLFSGSGSFLLEGISCVPVAHCEDAERFPRAQQTGVLFRYHNLTGSRSKYSGIEIVCDDVVAQIKKFITSPFINSDGTVGKAVRASDIAILTRTKGQAGELWKRLSAAGIAASDISERSVFATLEMEELYLLLAAIADIRLERIAAVLCTRIFAKSYGYVHELEAGAGGDFWLERFTSYRNTFRSAGFFALFERIASEQAISQSKGGEAETLYSRLLPLEQGARIITNYRHIAELLHKAVINEKLDEERLLLWAARRMSAHESEAEQPVRLDRDGDVVTIMTLHKSKGLEFPIIFLPFCWTFTEEISAKRMDAIFPYYRDGKRYLDLRDASEIDDQIKSRIYDERLAEEIRLLYVGMTRAKNALVCSFCSSKDSDRSALAWLFSYRQLKEFSAAALWGYLDGRDMAEVMQGAIAPCSDIGFVMVEDGEDNFTEQRVSDKPQLSLPRTKRRDLERDWAVGSFTLIEKLTRYGEKDYDLFAPKSGAASVTTLAPGARTGLLLHSLFESLDFTIDDAQLTEYAGGRLLAQNLSQVSVDEVCRIIRRTISGKLPGGISLDQIPRAKTLRELEFYFPVENARAIAEQLKNSSVYPNLSDLAYANFHGFMKGFIDLVFVHDDRWYIVDWKSNYLGAGEEDYSPAALRSEIAAHNYNLQYLIYTVALHRYLGSRLVNYSYTEHFGGVYYLFVRNASGGYGVHFDLPDYTLIQKIDASL